MASLKAMVKAFHEQDEGVLLEFGCISVQDGEKQAVIPQPLVEVVQ